MFAWTSHGTELKRFAKAPITRAAIVVLLLIPLLYGAMYVWAFKSPTDRLDNLPVALVNEDEGATVKGEQLHAGEQVVDKLMEKHPLGWRITNADDARDGIESGKYYFSVTIPKSYSADLASLDSSTPHKAELVVNYDDTNSFLASTLGRSAMTQIRDVVSENSGEKAADTLFIGMGNLRDGMGQAADGAFQLRDGLATAKSGADTLNLAAIQLNTGAQKINAGAQQLADGTDKAAAQTPQLATGVSQLATGSQQLVAALDTLNTQMPSLNTGATSLNTGAQQLATGATQLSAGSQRYVAGVQTAAAGAEQLNQSAGSLTAMQSGLASLDAGASGVNQGVQGVNKLAAGAQQALAAGDTATANQLLAQIAALTNAQGKLGAGAAQVSAGATALDQKAAVGIPALQNGIGQLHAGFASTDPAHPGLVVGAQQLSAASQQVSTGASKLAAGSSSLATGTSALADGVSKIDAGAHTLDGGVGQLNAKIPALVDGVQALDDGAKQLAAGTQQLADGTDQLQAKTPELGTGLEKATAGAGELGTKLNDGMQQLPHDSTETRQARANALANPVALDATTIHEARSWGEGFAPFFISLALWVGCLITWLILRPLQTRALMTSVNGFRIAWGSLNSALLLVVGQVAIMLAVMHHIIGIQLNNTLLAIGFVMLVGAAFMAMQQFFQIVFGSAVGKVIIIVILMVQLASCSGTYPIETEPAFLRAINPYMPMTYSVMGMREAITGGVDARFWTAVVVMAGIFAVSLVGSSIACASKRSWTVSRLHPALSL